MNGEFLAASVAIARRHLYKWIKVPANFMPTFIFPLIFFTGFAGSLGRIGNVPGFDYPASYTTWIFVFSLLQTCLFGGLATGFTIAAEFQTGFARRLMLAVSDRRAILFGYILSTFVRAAIMSGVVTTVAFTVGLDMSASTPVEVVGLYLLSWSMSIVGTLWAAGVMFRARDPQLGPAMQIPMFIAIFLAPVYVPLALLQGWLHAVASANPIGYVMTAGRNLLVGSTEGVFIAIVAAISMILLLTWWALGGVRSAERAGG
ncbi:MAG: ABC transporter permease [Thermoleophilia bacterium]|nr:ABC transporter permease [Thermoleophilia bacterium]